MGSENRRKSKLLRILRWTAFAMSPLVAIGTVVYVSLPDFDGKPHLRDEVLMANFQSQRTDFEKLLEMVFQDRQLTRVGDDWTEPRDPKTIGISVDRIAEYRRLFRKLGIESGFSAAPTRDQVQFLASTQGWVSHGSEKGYLYANSIPAYIGGVRESLDQYSSNERRVGAGCRHIEGNWYLHFYGD